MYQEYVGVTPPDSRMASKLQQAHQGVEMNSISLSSVLMRWEVSTTSLLPPRSLGCVVLDTGTTEDAFHVCGNFISFRLRFKMC